MSRTPIAIAGLGGIGRAHADVIVRSDVAELAAIVDPAAAARDHAATLGVPWYPALEALLAAAPPAGIILATPNQLHVAQALACIEGGIPTLVEKPIATDVAGGAEMVAAAAHADVPLLVGHHRRHNPLIQAAHRQLVDGAVGRIVAVHGICWFFKPDDYFATAWRREPGAGPVFINLIHDIDLLRYLCGEIVHVQALESNAVRGNPVEETAVILLRFDNGALGTVSVSDTVVSPWSWELTAGENPAYHPTDQACYLIGGTHGSLELPGLGLWRTPGPRSWCEPHRRAVLEYQPGEPLVRQVEHFCRVIAGQEPPLVSGEEGLRTLRVVEAIKRSAASGKSMAPD